MLSPRYETVFNRIAVYHRFLSGTGKAVEFPENAFACVCARLLVHLFCLRVCVRVRCFPHCVCFTYTHGCVYVFGHGVHVYVRRAFK